MAGPRRRNHAALHGRNRLEKLSQDHSEGEEPPKKESAESRKRRTRHEIWDLEDEITQWENKIAELEREKAQLHRRLELMQTTVRVRESQVQRLQQYGVCDAAVSSRLFNGSSRAQSSGLQRQCSPESLATTAVPDTTGSSASSAAASPSLPQGSSPGTPRPEAQPEPAFQGSIFDLDVDQLEQLANVLATGSSPLDKNTAQALQASPPSPGSSISDVSLVAQIPALGHSSSVSLIGQLQGATEAELALWSEAQIIETYKQASGYLSQLLFAAEDVTSPSAVVAASQLTQIITNVRRLGAIAKVCNPAMVRVVSRPVSEGLDQATEQHWDAVVSGLLLTPRQIEDGAILNDMRLKWQHRIQQDHAVVSRSLTEVLKEADGRWRATWDEGQVRKAEMMNKLHRVIGAERWVLVLVDELLTEQILDTMQIARCLVHSYPYVPDACAIVDAIARVYNKRQAEAEAALNAPAPAKPGPRPPPQRA